MKKRRENQLFLKLIFHNYLSLIDKSKYWHHVSLLLVWRGDNSQAWASSVQISTHISNERWKITFSSVLTFRFLRGWKENKRKSYLKHTLSRHDPNNKHFQRHLNGRKLIFFLLEIHNSLTNKQDVFTRNHFFWRFLTVTRIRNYQLQTKYQSEWEGDEPRRSFIKIFYYYDVWRVVVDI